MPITAAELAVVVSVDDSQVRPGMQRVDSAFSSMGAAGVTASGVISGAIGGLVAGVLPALVDAVGRAVVGIYEIGTAFDDASDHIRITTGAVGAELKALEGSFKTVFLSVPTTAGEASKAIAFLSARLHETGPNLEKLATAELELARITGSALAPQLEATTRLFKDWEVATGQQTEALDFLFKVGQKTATGVTDLSQKLVQFGAPLRELGFSFEQAAVLVGKFQAEGVALEKALPGLRQALSKMAKEGVTDAAAAFRGLVKEIQEAPTPMEALRKSIEIFGQRAGTDLVQAIRQGRFSLDEMMEAVQRSQETIIGAGKDTQDFAEKWVILKNTVTASLEPLGKIVLDAMSAIVSSFTDTSAEIEKRWSRLWTDLIHGTEEGTDGIITQILMAQDPAADAGAALAESIRSGFLQVLAKLGADFRSFEEKFGPTKIKFDGPQVSRHDWTKVLDLDGQKRVMDEILGYTDLTMEKMTRSTGRGGKASAKAFTDPFTKEIQSAMKAISQSIEDGLLGGDKIGRVLAEKITPAVDTLRKKGAELAVTMRAVGDAITAHLGLAMDTVTPKLIRGDGSLEALINRMIDLKRASETALRASREEFEAFSDTFKDLSSNLPQAWNTIIDSVLQGSGKLGTDLLKLGVKVKGYANDIINVFDTMPGKWGQSLNRALDEVNKWINFIDAAIRLIQRILGDAQTGLTGVFDSLSASMKKSTAAMEDTAKASQDASQDWAGALEKMSSSSKDSEEKTVNAFTIMSSAISGFVSGLGIAAATGSKAIGALGGAAMGAMQGFMMAGPWGALAGGIGGLLGGLFGGGKSAAQKKAEADAMENAKMNMQQTAQNIINSALEGFNKGLEFLNKLDEFTAPRKEKFKAFFKSFTKLLDYFVELSKSWSTTSMAQVKAAGEAIGPIADAISSLPAAFDAINGHFGLAQSSIDQFFNDFDRIITGFFTKVETWAVGRAKHARKIANNIAPAIDLMGPLLEAIKNMSSISRPPDEAFDIIEDVLETIVTRTAALSEKFDKALLKVMANFADRSGSALSLWSTAVGSIKDMAELKMPTEQDFANVFTGIEKVINGMIDVASRLTTEGLGRAEGMAQASLTLFASLKAGVEALSALKDFAGVLPDVFNKFFDDFNHAVDLVTAMAGRAIQFDLVSKSFKDYISSGAAHLATAFTMLAQIMNAAGSFFPGGSPGTSSAPMAPSSAVAASSMAAPLSYSSAPASAASQVNVTINAGTVVHESQLPDLIVKAMMQAMKRGQVSQSVFTGNLASVR